MIYKYFKLDKTVHMTPFFVFVFGFSAFCVFMSSLEVQEKAVRNLLE